MMFTRLAEVGSARPKNSKVKEGIDERFKQKAFQVVSRVWFES